MADAPSEPIQTIKVETKAPPKRKQTPAQKEAFQKALATLKAKREAQKKAQEEEAQALAAEKDEVKVQARQREAYEKAKTGRRKLPSERPTYITAAELQQFKLQMIDMMKPVKVVKEREVEVPVEKIVEKPIVVEKVIEKPTTKLISGNALLDSIFFK